MLSVVRFVGRRVAARLGRRSPWVSRVLVVAAAVRFVNGRARARRVVQLGRDDTLVVSLRRGDGDTRVV